MEANSNFHPPTGFTSGEGDLGGQRMGGEVSDMTGKKEEISTDRNGSRAYRLSRQPLTYPKSARL
jgi:hypothetical protein